MEWWPAAVELLTDIIPILFGCIVAISLYNRVSRNRWKLQAPANVFLLVTTNALYHTGDAFYHNGYNDVAAGIYRITRLTPDKYYPKDTQVYGELVFPGALSDCVGLQVCSDINRKIQCPHYWHHGPERPAHDENHVHPEPPKQPSNLVANVSSIASHVNPLICTYRDKSTRL